MNTTSVFDIRDLLHAMSARGVEKQLSRLAGVGAVSANGAAATDADAERASPAAA